MLTDKELDTYKICELPRESALIWIERIKNNPATSFEPFDDTGLYNTGHKCDLGGDTDELFIYRYTDGKYYLIQCLVNEVAE